MAECPNHVRKVARGYPASTIYIIFCVTAILVLQVVTLWLKG